MKKSWTPWKARLWYPRHELSAVDSRVFPIFVELRWKIVELPVESGLVCSSRICRSSTKPQIRLNSRTRYTRTRGKKRARGRDILERNNWIYREHVVCMWYAVFISNSIYIQVRIKENKLVHRPKKRYFPSHFLCILPDDKRNRQKQNAAENKEP